MKLFEMIDVNYGIKAGHPGAMFTIGDVYGKQNLNVPHAKLNVQNKNKKKTGIPESIDPTDQAQFINALRDLLPIAMAQLEIEKLPKIKLEKYVDDAEQPTFGRFVNDTLTIHIGIENRHIIDILRTLAHELVHYKQHELGELGPESGRTGSPAENEAHAVAGVIMRHFNLKHPEYFHDPAISLDEAAKVRLSTDPSNFGAYVSDTGSHEEKTVKIPVHKIDVFEPDAKFDEPKYAKNLKKIVNAIKAGKTLPPILVRRMPGLRYQVLDGHHRFKAYRLAGVKSIPARIVAPANVKVDEIKQRLDPKCWKGKHKEGTKIKGGVRVNNCVPNESVSLSEEMLTEEMLREAFLDSVTKFLGDKIKEPVSQVSNLSGSLKVLYQVISDPKKLETITFLLKKRLKGIIKALPPLAAKLKQFLSSMFPQGRTLADFFKTLLLVTVGNSATMIASKIKDATQETLLNPIMQLLPSIPDLAGTLVSQGAGALGTVLQALNVGNTLWFSVLNQINQKIQAMPQITAAPQAAAPAAPQTAATQVAENTTADGISNMFGNAFDPVVSNLQRVALLAMQGRQSEAASRLRTVIKSASPEAQQKITDAVNNIKPVTINGKVADSSTLEKSKEHNEWILKTFIPWVKNILSKHTVSEAPKDYDSMNLNSEDKQKSLDYFYNDHAPKFGKPKLAGRLGNYQVVNFVKDKLTLMFLVDQKEQPAFYVAFRKRPDGVAIGNVRSNGSIRATEVYKYLIDQYKTLYSDKVQTPDGRKIWANLARTYPELEITDVGTRLMARAKSNSVSEAGSPAQQAAIAITMKKAGKKPKKTREDANGPESKPTMPAGTVRVDVSDVYDWYKLGQHISNMKGLGNHDFGKGPPSTIISFGSEEEEHKYLKDLEKLGLPTTDIDPIDLKQPKGMKRQKVDPTYNVNEDESDAEIHNYEKLDKILSGLCQMVTDGQESEKDYGMVAAAVLDPDNRMVARLNRPGKNGKRIHAEHAAIIGYTKQHGDIPEGSIILTTLSPCNEAMDERDGPSCTDLINSTVVKKVYCGYIDPTQGNDTRQFNLMETGDKQIRIQCKEFADTFLDHVHEDLDEDVGGNYLYHATSADGLKSILQSGNIKAARGPQDATKAQTKMPSVSVSRDWGYASGSHARAQSQGGIGRDAVLILNRNAVENNFRTLGTSQSGDVRGAAYATAQKIRQYKLGSKSHFDDPEIEDEFNTIYRASKAGGEFEEAVVVPKGSLPIKNSLVGFWVNPKSELADDPAIMNDPRRLELAPGGTGRFVKASQQKDVSEGLEKNYLSQISNLSWKPVNRSVWNTIQDEGLDEEQDAPNHTDWVMASLTIDPKDAQALQAFDNDAVEDFNRFDIQLKDRYPGLTDLIDYDRGTVTIVKPINQSIDENFADGKNPQDKGDSKRYGVPTKASISTLRKFAKKHSGRAAQLAHWAANMKSGKRK